MPFWFSHTSHFARSGVHTQTQETDNLPPLKWTRSLWTPLCLAAALQTPFKSSLPLHLHSSEQCFCMSHVLSRKVNKHFFWWNTIETFSHQLEEENGTIFVSCRWSFCVTGIPSRQEKMRRKQRMKFRLKTLLPKTGQRSRYCYYTQDEPKRANNTTAQLLRCNKNSKYRCLKSWFMFGSSVVRSGARSLREFWVS